MPQNFSVLILELQFHLHWFKCMLVTAALHIFLQIGKRTIIKQMGELNCQVILWGEINFTVVILRLLLLTFEELVYAIGIVSAPTSFHINFPQFLGLLAKAI